MQNAECKMQNAKCKMENGNMTETNKSPKRPPCQFCGNPSTNIFFAAYVCDSEECIDKAREARGGPAGHKKDPKRWMDENR